MRLRAFPYHHKKSLSCLLSEETMEEIKVRYHYLLPHIKKSDPFAFPKFNFHILEHRRGQVTFEGMRVRHFSYQQAGMRVEGYRWGNFAYVTDIKDYGDEIFEDLEGVETLVLSAVRWKCSPVHFGIEDALAFIEKVGPKKNVYQSHCART